MPSVSFGVVTPIAADGEIYQRSVTIDKLSVIVDVAHHEGKVVANLTFQVPRPFIFLKLVSEDFVVRSCITMKRGSFQAFGKNKREDDTYDNNVDRCISRKCSKVFSCPCKLLIAGVKPEHVQDRVCWSFYIHLTNVAKPSCGGLQHMDSIYQAY